MARYCSEPTTKGNVTSLRSGEREIRLKASPADRRGFYYFPLTRLTYGRIIGPAHLSCLAGCSFLHIKVDNTLSEQQMKRGTLMQFGFTCAQWFLKTIMQVSGSTPFRTRDCPARFPLTTMEAIVMVMLSCGRIKPFWQWW